MAVSGPARWFFDAWSNFYDQALVQRLTYRPVQDAVVDVLRTLGACRVLDVGCGTGRLAARLERELDGAQVVGCDFSHGMLRHAAGHAPHLPWVQGDALHLPFRAASFNAVVSTEAFHWFPDRAAAVAEFFRVLVPGGRALVALVNTPNEIVRAAFRTGSRVLGQPFDWPTPQRMRALLEGEGFAVETQRRLWRLPAGLLLPPVLTVAIRPHGEVNPRKGGAHRERNGSAPSHCGSGRNDPHRAARRVRDRTGSIPREEASHDGARVLSDHRELRPHCCQVREDFGGRVAGPNGRDDPAHQIAGQRGFELLARNVLGSRGSAQSAGHDMKHVEMERKCPRESVRVVQRMGARR